MQRVSRVVQQIAPVVSAPDQICDKLHNSLVICAKFEPCEDNNKENMSTNVKNNLNKAFSLMERIPDFSKESKIDENNLAEQTQQKKSLWNTNSRVFVPKERKPPTLSEFKVDFKVTSDISICININPSSSLERTATYITNQVVEGRRENGEKLEESVINDVYISIVLYLRELYYSNFLSNY